MVRIIVQSGRSVGTGEGQPGQKQGILPDTVMGDGVSGGPPPSGEERGTSAM